MLLCVDQFAEHDFLRRIADIVHFPDPFHLIFCLEPLRDTLTLCHLLNQPRKQILCLLVDVDKVGIQLSTEQQRRIKAILLLPEIFSPPLAPDANRNAFRRYKVGNEVIAFPMVSDAVLLE
jgi:hypothetical protein